MYTFSSINDTKYMQQSSYIDSVGTDCRIDQDVILFGKLQALFGKPLYETDDYENAYCYIIKATSEENEDFYFTIYQGSTGCAIGGQKMDHQMKLVIDALKETLNKVKPLDYERVWIYEDSYSQIECGIRNGEVFIIERDWME